MSLYIYHERQSTQSALCGVHCLNTLLQRPAFTEIELAKLAAELDDKEREVMALAGDTKEYRKFLSEESSNVGDDGNFSLQVLQAALHKRNCECIPLTTSNYYTVVCNLSKEFAFICNRGAHWYTIRKVLPGEWYNFNSLLDEPQHMPEAHLASYLDDLFDKKDVCIYSVKGSLPSISPENRPSSGTGRWIIATGSNKEEFELKIAIEASKAMIEKTTEKSNKESNNPTIDTTTSGGEISYPKLPDFKNEKISYPTIEVPSEEQPLVLKNKNRIPTKDLPIQEHLRLINEYFEKCIVNMERIDQRLTSVEKTFTIIQGQQK